MKRLLVCLPFLLLPALATAQEDCTLAQYQKLLTEADQATAKGQYDLAINKLQSAKICRPEREEEVSRKILVVFNQVNDERRKAKLQEQLAKMNAAEAKQQQDLAETRLKQAEEAQRNAEKSSRSIINTTLFRDIQQQNPTLALRVAQYNLNWYSDHAESVSNLYDVIKDTNAVFFKHILRGHKKDVNSLVFSPDGKYLASGGGDEITIIWELATWKKTAILQNTQGKPNFSPDSKYLAVGRPGSVTLVWEVGSWNKAAVLKETAETWCVTFSTDNKYLVSGGGETARIWDTQRWNMVATLNVFEIGEDEYEDPRNVEAVAFSPDNKYLLTLDMEQVKVWNTDSWTADETLTGDDGWVHALAFSPGGEYLATGNGSSAIIWNTETWKPHHTIKGALSLVYALAFSPDGKYLATGNRDNTARLWSTDQWRELAVYKGHQAAMVLGTNTTGILAVAFSADSKYLASGSLDNTALIWEVKDKNHAAFKTRVTENGSLAAFSPDGRYLAVSADRYTHTAKILESGTWREVSLLETHKDRFSMQALAFSFDNKYGAAGCDDGSAIIWETASGNQWAELNGHDGSVDGIAFSPDGKYLATSGMDKSTIIWDIAGKIRINSWKDHRYQTNFMVFSPDNRFLLRGGEDSICNIREIQTGEIIHVVEDRQKLYCGAFSPDGKYIAVGGQDNLIKVWEFGTWDPVWTLQQHAGDVRSLVFSANGRYVASGSIDQTVKIWDMTNGKSLATLRGARTRVYNVAFSPDAQFVYNFCWNGTSGVFNPFEDCIDCRAYHYSLSELRAAGLQPEPPDLLLLWEQSVKLKETELRSIGKNANKNK